jgi:hypothetical protein
LSGESACRQIETSRTSEARDRLQGIIASEALHGTVEQLAAFAEPRKPDVVLGAEAGFISAPRSPTGSAAASSRPGS